MDGFEMGRNKLLDWTIWGWMDLGMNWQRKRQTNQQMKSNKGMKLEWMNATMDWLWSRSESGGGKRKNSEVMYKLIFKSCPLFLFANPAIVPQMYGRNTDPTCALLIFCLYVFLLVLFRIICFVSCLFSLSFGFSCRPSLEVSSTPYALDDVFLNNPK